MGVGHGIDGEIVPVYGCLYNQKMKMRRGMGMRQINGFWVTDTARVAVSMGNDRVTKR